MSVAVVWFRNDLRLDDQPALHAGLQADKLVLLYVLDERMGAASRWWLHHSLNALTADIEHRGGQLVLRQGKPAELIPALMDEVGADELHVCISFEPAMRAADKTLDEQLTQNGRRLVRHVGTSLLAPAHIRSKSGGPYNVYTPFSRACLEAGVPDASFGKPRRISTMRVKSEKLQDWALLPTKPDWSGGMDAEWEPGEAGAVKRVKAFLDGPIATYDEARNLPGTAGTSKLSPHVHFGEVSPRRLWHRAAEQGRGKGVQTFLKELLWREFSLNLLWEHKDLRTVPIRAEFADFPWDERRGDLAAWQRGQTGIPIVDAGMRELWQTGWMHNRVRMIVASFLTKHLLVPWQAGEAWFWDTLCEADEAANGASWQWVAGCGADAAPYFRVFNPVLQGRKFDGEGTYVRSYVPEIAGLPDKYLHAPWEAPEEVLNDAQLTLGKEYPKPIIDLKEGRARALCAYEKMKAHA
jgi:deoxyribodipyrimidine photo-lyase